MAAIPRSQGALLSHAVQPVDTYVVVVVTPNPSGYNGVWTDERRRKSGENLRKNGNGKWTLERRAVSVKNLPRNPRKRDLSNGFVCIDCGTLVPVDKIPPGVLKHGQAYRCKECHSLRRKKLRKRLKRTDPLRWKARGLSNTYKSFGHNLGIDAVLGAISAPLMCPYCLETIPPRKISLDHILPRSRGGTNELTNLQYTCMSCNSMKGNLTDDEFKRLLAFFSVNSEM